MANASVQCNARRNFRRDILAAAVAFGFAAMSHAQIIPGGGSEGDFNPALPFANDPNADLIIGDTGRGWSYASGFDTARTLTLGNSSTPFETGFGELSLIFDHTLHGGMFIGRQGGGILNLIFRGTLSVLGTGNESVSIATLSGSNGTINLSDQSRLRVVRADGTPQMFVGQGGRGALNISSGSRVTLGDATSGQGLGTGALLQIGGDNSQTDGYTGGQGIVNVTGTDSLLNLLGENQVINVGRMGSAASGELNVTAGGVVRAGSFVAIGRGRADDTGIIGGYSALGRVLIDGRGSEVSITRFRTAGDDAGNGARLLVGTEDGIGILTIRERGTLNLNARGATADAGGVDIGFHNRSTGTVNIESGARMILIGDAARFGMSVGRSGTGSLRIAGGGQLDITNESNLGGGLWFGGAPDVSEGGTFTGSVSGGGSSLALAGVDMSVTIGLDARSAGAVTISDGATLRAAGGLIVGANRESSGVLNVSGAGTNVRIAQRLEDALGARLAIGSGGIGTVNVGRGAVITIDGNAGPQRAVLTVGGTGTQAGGVGLLTVSDAGTRIDMSAQAVSFTVGRDSTGGGNPSAGTVIIRDGAQIHLGSNATGSIGYTRGSTGTVIVTGTDSRLDAGSFLGIGRTLDDQAGGSGLLNVADGGTVRALTIRVGTSGTIAGNGTIQGNVVNDGFITPGNSPGTLHVTGDLTLGDSSLLLIEIAGTGRAQFDVIAIGGTLQMDGTLRVRRLGAYTPAVGDAFPILTFATATGTFDRIEYEGYAAGVTFATSVAPSSFDLTVSAVPEPQTFALMLAGLGCVTYIARRRSPGRNRCKRAPR